MLTAAQHSELVTTGVTHLRGALPRADADAMADEVWAQFETRGVVRADPSTWPRNGLQVKLQKLRKSGVFSPFANEIVSAAVTELLGPGWYELDAWGGPLISFPNSGPWKWPESGWHLDFPAQGSPDEPGVLRLFGFVNDVGPHGGGTVFIEGSHELIRRLVAAAPAHDAGSSAQVKKRLFQDHPWLRAPNSEPYAIDGVDLRAAELTGQAGDVVLMLPWTMHNVAMNCADQPRFMVTHTVYR
jgi:hypothetical protein